MTVPATRARADASRSKAVVSLSRNSSSPMTVILKAKVSTAAGSISSGWTRPAAPTASRVAEKKAMASTRPKAAPRTPLEPAAHQAMARATGAAAAGAGGAAGRGGGRPPAAHAPPLGPRPPASRDNSFHAGGTGRWSRRRPGVEVDGESTSRDRGKAKQARPLQRPVGPADTREVRPRLVALVLLVLLASCGGPERPAKAPAAAGLVGTAGVRG